MVELRLHGQLVETVFDLLGKKENDITYSVGWALANCSTFCELILAEIFTGEAIGAVQAIKLQQFGADRGFTDIEILTERTHVIVEAKRGWMLPGTDQLE